MAAVAGKMFGDNTNYYEVLGVSKDASPGELNKAYEEAYVKGGDSENITLAYEVLSDPSRREIYHSFRRDLIRTLEVSLEDLYKGASKETQSSRLAICSKCDGKGSKSNAWIMKCSACQGSGLMPHPRHFIPGMQHPCFRCKSTGVTLSETIRQEDRCEECKGEKVVRKYRILEIPVGKGMQNGQKITLPRDLYPTATGGDLVCVLQQNEHDTFKRKGDDLFVEHSLSAVEALFGFQFELTHLDNRQLIIKSKPGEVVKNGQFKAVSNEGMPVYQEPSRRGKLYIHFTVYEFPDALTLTPELRKTIEAVLHPRPSTDMEVVDEEGKKEIITLEDVNQQKVQEVYDDMHRREMKKLTDMPKDIPGETTLMMKVLQLKAAMGAMDAMAKGNPKRPRVEE